MSDFKPGEEEGVHKETCDLTYNGKAICRPELTVTPAMPVLYCAVKKNTARCKFCPPTIEGGEFHMAVKEKIRIRIKGYDHALVDQSAEKIVETAKRTGARVSGPVPLPTEKEVVTIIRAVHKYKDSREQFEMRTHKRLIDVIRPSNKTVEALTGLELPAGVEIEIKL